MIDKIENWLRLWSKSRIAFYTLLAYFFAFFCISVYLVSSMFLLKPNDFLLFIKDISLQLYLLVVIGFGLALIQNFFSDLIRNRPSVSDYLKKVRTELKILGITLNDLHREEANVNAIYKSFKEKISPSFFQKLSNEELVNKHFQFLLLNPGSPAFIQRANDEGKKEIKLQLECAKSVRNLNRLQSRLFREGLINPSDKHNTFDFQFYDSTPTHSLIITDSSVMIGPYLYNLPGTETKWIKIVNIKAIAQYDQEFTTIWEKSKSITDVENESEKNKNLFLISKNIPITKIDEYLQIKDVSEEENNNLKSKFNNLILCAQKLNESVCDPNNCPIYQGCACSLFP